MEKNKFIVIIIIALLTLPITTFWTANVSAAYVVGAEVGDWVKYNTFTAGQTPWKSEERDWVKVEVQNVSGTNVTLHLTTRFNNGSKNVQTINSDIKVGSVDTYIIAGNLSAGDKIFVAYRHEFRELSINSTVSRNYGGVSRDVNLLKWSVTLPYFEDMMNCSQEYCWDKKTGFLLETKQEAFIPGYKNTTWGMWLMEIAETNMWEMGGGGSPPWEQYLLLTTLAVAFAVTGVVIFKNRSGHKK